MGDVKISEMTPDSSIGGSEIIPVSDSETAKSVTIDDIVAYAVDEIEAISAGTVVDGDDQIYILDDTDSALKPVDIDTVLQHGIDTIWGKSAETSPDDADILALKDGGTTEKTVTLAYLAAYVLATIESDILDISGLDEIGSISDSDEMLIVNGTTAKKTDFTDVSGAVLANLKGYMGALGAVTVSADSDVFYCDQGGTQKKVTLTTIKTYLGDPPSAPASTTLNGIPQWTNTSGDLKDGLGLVTEVGSMGSDSNVPSEQGVREALSTVIYDQTDIGAALVDADTILVDDGALGTTQRKSAISRLWTYILAKISAADAIPLTGLDIDGATDIGEALADADLVIVDNGAGGTNRKSAVSRIWTYILAKIVAVTDISSYGFFLDENTLGSDDDTKVPSQQSVKAYVDALQDYVDDEVANIANLNIDGGTDIGAGLADADLIIVDDGAGGTNRKSALSRMWTYILAKLEAATGVSLTSPTITTKLTFNETTNDLDVTASDQSSASGSVNMPDINGIAATAQVFPTAVDGTLGTGANADFVPVKLVYNKTCSDSDGDDVIDLHNGTYLGQIFTIYLGTKSGSDNAVITPVTAVSYSTITLDAATEIATLQWQGATVGWAILYTNGTVA